MLCTLALSLEKEPSSLKSWIRPCTVLGAPVLGAPVLGDPVFGHTLVQIHYITFLPSYRGYIREFDLHMGYTNTGTPQYCITISIVISQVLRISHDCSFKYTIIKCTYMY